MHEDSYKTCLCCRGLYRPLHQSLTSLACMLDFSSGFCFFGVHNCQRMMPATDHIKISIHIYHDVQLVLMLQNSCVPGPHRLRLACGSQRIQSSFDQRMLCIRWCSCCTLTAAPTSLCAAAKTGETLLALWLWSKTCQHTVALMWQLCGVGPSRAKNGCRRVGHNV